MSTPTSIQIEDGQVQERKEYFVKIYAQNGDYIGTSDDISFNGFSKTINGGLGELSISIARAFDEFGEGEDIDFMNEVQLWIIDKESGSSGQKIYSGLIDTYTPYANAQGEGVDVKCVGYGTRLGQVLYKDGTTVNITHNSVDPSIMFKDVINKFRAAVPSTEDPRINFSATSVETVGSNASYTFVLKDCQTALDKVRSFAPANWFYYIGADNIVRFQSKPSQATHTFTFGKDVADIRVEKNIRDTINQVVLFNGETGASGELRSYSDSDSQGDYGLRMAKKTDSRWANTDTMDLVGDSFLNARKVANIRVTAQIIDSNQNENGYDIESVRPGDTCRVLNLPDTFTTLNNNMTITSINYRLGAITIQLEELQQSLSKKFTDVVKELQERGYSDNDTTDYTEVS